MQPRNILFILLVFTATTTTYSQTLQTRLNTLVGSKDQLPFWLWANQLGRYDRTSSAIVNLGVDGNYAHYLGESGWGTQVGGSFDVLLNSDNPVRFTELYGGINWKFLQLTAGAFADEEKYMGLSSSNGNIANSRNARPHPKIRAGFNRYVPVLVDWFSLYGFYEEGLLNDDRYVMDTHLHRKAFYFRLGRPQNFTFSLGIEHFVMWGGTHPVYGELPGWESYFDYVLGKSGDEDALMTDQLNVMGNQYGTYQLELQKRWNDYTFTYYMSHPFDDLSGMNLENIQDNIYGIFISTGKEKAHLKGISIEYYNTRDQSGAFHLVLQEDGSRKGHGTDDYFNHGIYRSGATYQQTGMVSPFFAPEIRTDSVSLGFESTRFSGISMGASGYITESFQWKTMISYIVHAGKYTKEGTDAYDPHRSQFSSLFQMEWCPVDKPFTVGGSLALDSGSVFDEGVSTTRPGFSLFMSWILP